MTFLSGLFIIVLAGMAVGAITEIAKAVARRGASTSELSQLKGQLERYAVALEDAQATLANQATQLAELHDRLDFAERLLVKARDRAKLEAGQRGE